MALAKVTIESLLSMQQTMKKAWNDIVDIKLEVDYYCYCFEWDDPIGRYFIAKYEEGMAPIKEKLLPMLEQYADYLGKLTTKIEEFSETPHMHITGGENIASILPKGTPTDPITIAPNAVPHIPNETLQPMESSSEIPIKEEPSLVAEDAFLDADFEARISDMSQDSLDYLNQTYQDYSDLSGIAGYSYQDGIPLPNGWEDLGQQDPAIQRIIDDVGIKGGNSSGLKFSVLKKAGEDKYVVAFAGTDFPIKWTELYQDKEFLKDARADVQGMFSQDEEQIKLAKAAVQRLCKEGGIPLENMEFTGHSLGGRLAAEMSVQYARPATTFNAAGVSEETRKQYEYLLAHSKNHYTGVRNVVAEHDFLTNFQSMGSGAKNEYIAALPKEEIKIIHETISGTLSSTEGKVAKKALDVAGPLGTGASRVIDGVDTAFTWADRFNEYYNRDYRALGGKVVLPDGKNGISGEAHGINFVSELLNRRHNAIENRLNTIEQWKRTPPSWNENTSIPLHINEIAE